jgi:hypothetical protein
MSFTHTKRSLQFSQELAYQELDESNLYGHTLFFKDPFQ